MALLEAIEARHSVRKYKNEPIPDDILTIFRNRIQEINEDAGLHIQPMTDDPKAFSGLICYGTLSGVKNYFVLAGKKGDDLDEKVSYSGFSNTLL